MAPSTYVSRSATRAAFALIILLILGLAWLCRAGLRAWKAHRAAQASLHIA